MTQRSSETERPGSTEPAHTDALLRALIALFRDPEYQSLRQYAELTTRGHPDEAVRALWAFITEASGWPIRRRRQAAVRIAEAALNTGSGPGSVVLPDPLWTEFVEPTLQDWAAADDVALPHRLLGLVDRPTYRHLSRAHVFDPDDQLVAHRLAVILIRDIDLSAVTLGEFDLAKLDEAERVIATLQDDQLRQSLGARLDGLRERLVAQARTPEPGTKPSA